ncbi:hypothetical protein TCSYLVIO_009299 [Trypanosoma cruzi]|nr:hypothetical protein TCSYLVIO_009299 [Trypanosoma cruzi]
MQFLKDHVGSENGVFPGLTLDDYGEIIRVNPCCGAWEAFYQRERWVYVKGEQIRSQYGPLRNSSQHGTPIAVSVTNSCLRIAATQKVSKPPSTIHPRNISQQATEDSMIYGVKGLAEVNQQQHSPMGRLVQLITNTALLGKVHLEITISVMLNPVCQVCQLHRRGTHTTICILVGVWRPHPKQSLQHHFLSNLSHDGSKADGSI